MEPEKRDDGPRGHRNGSNHSAAAAAAAAPSDAQTEHGQRGSDIIDR